PGEISTMKPGLVDTSGDVWQYVPEDHKTKHQGKQRIIFIGPRAQAVLMPYLLRPADQHCFRPCDSEKRRRRELHEQRKTPLHHGNRPGTNRKRKPEHKPGEVYSKDSLNKAVRRAVEKANEDREAKGLPTVK